MKTSMSVFLVFALCFTQCACTQSQIINDLEIAADAASAAAPIVLGAAGLPAGVVNYVADANKAITCASTAIEAGGSSAAVAAEVVGCLATAVAPALPAGTPETVVAVVSALDSDIQSILKQYTASAQAALKAVGGEYHMSTMDKYHVHKIKSITHKTAVALAKGGVF